MTERVQGLAAPAYEITPLVTVAQAFGDSEMMMQVVNAGTLTLLETPVELQEALRQGMAVTFADPDPQRELLTILLVGLSLGHALARGIRPRVPPS